MNIQSITNYTDHLSFEVPFSTINTPKPGPINNLPFELLDGIFRYLTESERSNFTTVCHDWKNCVISLKAHQTQAKVFALARLLCGNLRLVRHRYTRGRLEGCATNDSIIESPNLPSIQLRANNKLKTMTSIMANLPIMDLHRLADLYKNEKQDPLFGRIVLDAASKHIRLLPNNSEQGRLLSDLCLSYIECQFPDPALIMARPLINHPGFNWLEVIKAFGEQRMFHQLFTLFNDLDPNQQIDAAAQGARAIFKALGSRGLGPFLAAFAADAELKDAAYFGAAFGSIDRGCITLARLYIKSICVNRGEYLNQILTSVSDRPAVRARLESLR